jgi:hypothetical protein
MNYGRLFLATVVSMVVYFLYGFLVEGLLIRNDFAPFSAVYRSAETVKPYMPLGMASILISIFVVAILYAKGYEGGRGLAEGFRFGLLVGVFVVCAFVTTNFVILNIGGKLVLKLAVSALVQWTIIGIVIGTIYKPAPK